MHYAILADAEGPRHGRRYVVVYSTVEAHVTDACGFHYTGNSLSHRYVPFATVRDAMRAILSERNVETVHRVTLARYEGTARHWLIYRGQS